MEILALFEGWPLVRDMSNTIIQNLFSEIVVSLEGWPLVRVATYTGDHCIYIGLLGSSSS